MQVPNQRVFSLNSAVTPEIQWGSVNPAVAPDNATLTAMPVGSIYIQQIGSPTITSCVAWVKVLSDIVAAQNMVNPWTSYSQARVTAGDATPNFSSDEFMMYQPGMVYVQTTATDTGAYRTAWIKVSNGGTRANWVSIAESEVLQRVYASISAASLSIAIAPAVTLTWRYPTTGTPTVLEVYPTTAGITRTDLRLNIPTTGLYEVRGGCVLTNSVAINCALALSVDSVAGSILLDSAYDHNTYGIRMQGSRLVRLQKNNVVGIAVAALAASGTFTLTEMNLSIVLVAP